MNKLFEKQMQIATQRRRSGMMNKVRTLFVGLVLWAAVGAGSAMAQEGTLTGLVTSAATGGPLVSVQVFIEGTGVGGLTQGSGRFLILNVSPGTYSVTADRIGYASVTRQVSVMAGETAVLDYVMEEEALALDEIIVTGTAGGTQRRAIGNQVERLDVGSVLEVSPAANIEEVLTGRIPGLYVTQSGGNVGFNGSKVRIRGVSSVGVPNDPIVYVDGIRVNSAVTSYGSQQATSRLNDINPQDIESIEVIKGPAAATLYGTEASNGVIQIITKRGVSGAPSYTGRLEYGANWFNSPRSTIGDRWDRDPNTGEVIGPLSLYQIESDRLGRELFQNGPIAKASLAVRGGTDFIRYYGSFDRSYEEGFVAWNHDTQMSGRLNVSVTASPSIEFTFNGSFNKGNTRSAGGNIWGTFMRQQLSTVGEDPASCEPKCQRGFQIPPEIYEEFQFETFELERNTWNIELKVNPQGLPWLQNRLILGRDRATEDEIDLTRREEFAPNHWFGSRGLGRKELDVKEVTINTFDFSSTAAWQVTSSLGTATSIGAQYFKTTTLDTFLRGDEFATFALTTVGAAARTESDEDFLQNITMGAYVQEQFDWEQRLFLTLALRVDDNSAFGTNFDVAKYPKVSGAWVVSEESFFDIGFIEQLRLRSAWGQAGQQPDVFAATRLYTTQQGPGGVPILTPSAFGNPDLGPEKGQELEVGFEASLFGGRVGIDFSQYWKTTKNAIVSQIVSESFGFPGTQFVNAGEIRNWGTEVGLQIMALDAGFLRWDVGIAAARMKNEATTLGDQPRILIQGRYGTYHVEGFPLASLWAPHVVSADFVSGNSGQVENIMCDSGIGPEGFKLPGGPPVLCSESAPLLYYGRTGEPTWTLNMSNTITLGNNVRLFANIDGRGGHGRVDQDIAAGLTSWDNLEARVFEDNAIFQAQRSIDRVPAARYRAGFFSLRELALQYNLPASFADRVGASRISVKAAAHNVVYLWREQSLSDIVNVPVPSPERDSRAAEFGGGTHTATPPLQRAVFTVNFTF